MPIATKTKKNQNNENKPKNKKRYFPSSFLIIILLMIFVAIVSWILHWSGVTTKSSGTKVEIRPTGISNFLVSMAWGFVDKAPVIIFILVIGGTLGVMAKTKAIDAGIEAVIVRLKDKVIWVIPILMLIFGLGGTTYGMWEETIAFFPILIPIFIKAKLGPFIAVLTILLGAGVGCLASTVNPFAIAVAFDASKDSFPHVSQSTMLGARWVSFFIFEAVTISLVTLMAIRIRAKKLIITGIDEERIAKKFRVSKETVRYNLRRKFTVAVFVLGFVFMILSYLPWSSWIPSLALPDTAKFNPDSFWNKYFFWIGTASPNNDGSPLMWATWGSWYFLSVAGIFILISLVVFAINHNDFVSEEDNKEGTFINAFINGSKDVLPVCLLIATAAGLGIILSASNIGLLIANSVSNIGSVGIIGYVLIMFIMSLILSFLIPSTSGFAAAFIPIFAGITASAFGHNHNYSSVQVDGIMALVILGFAFASGIVNLCSPTSAALMAYTQYSGIPFPVWIQKMWKILLILLGISILLLILFSAMLMGGISF